MDLATPATLERTGLVFGPTWRSFTSTQGGLVVGHLLQAAADLAGAAPRAVTAHLLGGVATGVESVVTAAADRSGRTGSIRSGLTQDRVLLASAQTLTLARPATPGIEHWAPDELPQVADGEPVELPRDYVPVAEHIEVRALGATRPLGGGTEPRLHAWARIRGVELEPLVQLGLLLDALPPSLFAVRTVPAAMPTVELTAHLARPAPEPGAWVRIDQRTVWCDADVAIDDVELRAEDGALVARGRQTRRLLGP
ncbi:thioesterase family protein [Blastococcus saxobsidens]|uniref:Thioesterase family protein n=1 Tax=Blastococcus saxobsidens TaxID=138336 RepID=A0A6L9VZ18_9ACTN|nr:acyl-CoA thioesterase domain-containing protein [Blastococcus saxobsidens]NEK84782.1 thioesterase family protein [Blastococcus saxobsidens]